MSQTSELYPLTFYPILKEKIWGGNKLKQLFNKNGEGNIGESWEISGVNKNVSLISNGNFQGKNLQWLLEKYQENLVGHSVYNIFGNTFPLLFKLIDAKEDLSVQLHPNDKIASTRHNSFGKTEMWYILDSENESNLILGFNSGINKSIYKKHLLENTLSEILHSEKVYRGDSFFIETGTVHAIGAGVLLAEIQQTSDITYRIYDYNRPGINGELRELHTDLALKAINFDNSNSRLIYSKKENKIVEICKNKYFQTNKLVLTKPFKRNLYNIDSFVVYMCVEGEGVFNIKNYSNTIVKGETILIPAEFEDLIIQSDAGTFLEVYIP